MSERLHINVYEVLERYHAIRKPCPKCGELMTPLGDPPDKAYLWCFDCEVRVEFE